MAEPHILFEDNHLLALVKPPGMPSQGDISGDLSCVDWAKAYLKATYHKPGEAYVALLHRLDRPTGGVLLLAKTSKAAARMTEQFKRRAVHKVYWALTLQTPRPPEGRLVHHLLKLEGTNVIKAFNKAQRGTAEAVLDYRVRAERGGVAVVEVRPLTGRQHQIRVQLARIACPLVGDVKYGAPAPLPDQSIALWAVRLTVAHPVTQQPLVLTAYPPTEREPWQAVANLSLD